MGNISANKLAGLSLIIGPVLALICYFIQPGQMLIDAADPANAQEVVAALQGNSELSILPAILIPVGLIILLHGIARLVMESGDSLSSLGLKFIFVGTAGWVVTNGILGSIAGSGPEATVLYGAAQGVTTFSGIVFSLGFVAINLGISGKDYINKNVAYVVALAALVSVVVSVIGGFDSSTLQTMSMIGGICYIIWTLWSIWLGKDMMARN